MKYLRKIRIIFLSFLWLATAFQVQATKTEPLGPAGVPLPMQVHVASVADFQGFIESYKQARGLNQNALMADLNARIRFSGPFSVFQQVSQYQHLFVRLYLESINLESPLFFAQEDYPFIQRVDVLSDGGDFEELEVLQFFCHFIRLKHLCVTIKSIDDDCTTSILNAVHSFCPELIRLKITGICDLEVLPLCKLPALQHLELVFDEGFENCLQDTQNINAENFPQLEALCLMLHDLKSVSSLKDMTCLKSLFLVGWAVFDTPPVLPLEEVLPTLTSLKTLCVYRNTIQDLSAMGQGVASQITDLHLAASSMTTENQAFVLASMLNLKTLSFLEEDFDAPALREKSMLFFQQLESRNVQINWDAEMQY